VGALAARHEDPRHCRGGKTRSCWLYTGYAAAAAFGGRLYFTRRLNESFTTYRVNISRDTVGGFKIKVAK
jgi:hypothetical protein